MDGFPIEGAFLSEKIGSSEMLRFIISNQTVQIEGVRILRFFNAVVESAGDNRVRNSTK